MNTAEILKAVNNKRVQKLWQKKTGDIVLNINDNKIYVFGGKSAKFFILQPTNKTKALRLVHGNHKRLIWIPMGYDFKNEMLAIDFVLMRMSETRTVKTMWAKYMKWQKQNRKLFKINENITYMKYLYLQNLVTKRRV